MLFLKAFLKRLLSKIPSSNTPLVFSTADTLGRNLQTSSPDQALGFPDQHSWQAVCPSPRSQLGFPNPQGTRHPTGGDRAAVPPFSVTEGFWLRSFVGCFLLGMRALSKFAKVLHASPALSSLCLKSLFMVQLKKKKDTYTCEPFVTTVVINIPPPHKAPNCWPCFD